MSSFVFRNNTIESFFGKDYTFSGYDDISCIPTDVDSYIWFYQIPIKYDHALLSNEVNTYVQKLMLVLSQIDKKKNVIILTMDRIYSVPLVMDDHRLSSAINEYNETVKRLGDKYSNVKTLDITTFTRGYAANDLIDWKFYFISQMGLNPRLAGPFKKWFRRQVEALELKRKKCLVLDLDNTIWGGILGEEGIDGIKIGGDYPGKAFLYFQEALLELSKNGVILTICSKNNEQDVLDAWEKNPFIILKKEYFATYRINWNDKVSNIKEIAEELNIGLDSLVFIDDNPTERELVKQLLPMIEVPEFPIQPYELPSFFQSIVDNYFKIYTLTNEDKKKTEQYRANASRIKAQRSFTDFSKFLETLEMKLVIESANDFSIQRIAQMTQKTNQFNLTTRRYTDVDIKSFLFKGALIYTLCVSDKFGENGITGCIIIKNNHIDSFLLSCRILGKGIEKAFMYYVLNILKSKGIQIVTAEYLPTVKNVQVKGFYEDCGFTCESVARDGSKRYVINLQKVDLIIEKYYCITIN